MPDEKRIVIVDDHPRDLEAFKKVYRNTGVRICQAGSEYGLFNVIEQYGKRADAIILDTSLKGADSLELADKLRSNARYRDIPIVLISDNVSTDMISRVKALQIQHLIKKPFCDDYLKKTVESLFEKQEMK